MFPFHQICPKLATAECRSIKFEGVARISELPLGEYHLLESYCTEKDCDCRRVMLNVATQERIEATISFGFDTDDPMRGPFLDPINKQGAHANELLSFVEQAVLSDPEYVARLERHYEITKQITSGTLRPDDAQPSPRLTELTEVFRPTAKALTNTDDSRTDADIGFAPFDIHQSVWNEDGEDGENDEELADEYANALTDRFADSPEAESLQQRDANLGWPHTFLYYSIAHLGLTPPHMSASDVDEVLFEIMPRKVSVEAESADEIITVLRAFWQYLRREFQLQNADQVLKLFDTGATERLHDALDDPANFGMAKSAEYFRGR